MGFSGGDLVHVAGFGRGVVREARNGGRYLVEVKGRAMVVDESSLSPGTPEKAGRHRVQDRQSPPQPSGRGVMGAGTTRSLDLHGCTVEQALERLDRFLNDALLADALELRVVHGRSGGRIKAATHRRLGAIAAVRAYRVDPSNPGVTIVVL